VLSFSGEMAEEVVRIEGVWVRIGASVVLEDVNLSIKKGDFLGIIGPNGGGKTTLLRVIRPQRRGEDDSSSRHPWAGDPSGSGTWC